MSFPQKCSNSMIIQSVSEIPGSRGNFVNTTEPYKASQFYYSNTRTDLPTV